MGPTIEELRRGQEQRASIKFGKIEFLCAPEVADRASAIIYRNRAMSPRDATVRRVLDLGAGHGEFLIWAWRRWPNAWIDWTEDAEEKRKFAFEIQPPGAKFVPTTDGLNLSEYDVIHVGAARFAWAMTAVKTSLLKPIVICDVEVWP